MTSKVVVDENLITGQNPFSSKEIAKVVMQKLTTALTLPSGHPSQTG